MPVKATPFIKLLQSVLQKSIDERLEQIRSILPSVESGSVKNTEPLARKFVEVLTSVVRSSDATPEQLVLAAEYRSRVSAVDPRNETKSQRPRTEREAYLTDLAERKPKAAAPQSDGYNASFLDIGSAVDRVISKYNVPPPYTDLENQRLLETFLGDVLLTAESAKQIWLHLTTEFKNRGGSATKPFTTIFPPVVIAVQTALCQFVNSRRIAVP
jgi:hypothetical protein